MQFNLWSYKHHLNDFRVRVQYRYANIFDCSRILKSDVAYRPMEFSTPTTFLHYLPVNEILIEIEPF